jgi:hypothetical protein
VQTPTQYAATVKAAIAAVDPQGEADRHAAAKKGRDVWASRDSDGMGVLVDRDDAATIDAIHAVLTDAARALQAERGGTAAARAGDPDARLGACRADVLKTLILGPRPAASGGPDTATGSGSSTSGGGPGSGGSGTGSGSGDPGSSPAPGHDPARPVTATGSAGRVGSLPVGPGPGGSWEPR